MTLPNFVVAGAGRSGTTALTEGLRAHPDVFITRPKEPHYFAFHGRDLDFRGPGDDKWVNAVAVTDKDRYLSLYDGSDQVARRGEGSVSTLHYAEHAAPEIARINPEMKVVVILREPVERAFSAHAYLRLRGVEPEPDFRRALDLEQQRVADNWHHMWHYAAMSRYSVALEHLLEAVGPDRLGIWFYDEMRADYPGLLDEVAQFLELAPFTEEPSLPKVNVSGTARSELAQRTIRWATRHQSVRATLKGLVPFPMRERIRSAVVRSEDVPSDVHDDLAPLFSDDLRRLAALVPEARAPWLSRPVS